MRKRRCHPGPIAALLLLAALPLIGCVPEGGDGPALTPAPEPSWQEVAARLPERIGSFQRGSAMPLPAGATGLEIPYANPGRVIAGYVRIIPQAAAPVAEAALQQHVAEVTGAAAAHRRLGEQARLDLPAGREAFFRCVELGGHFGRQPVDSLLCSGARGRNLIQLRLTMARREGRLEQAREFAAAVAAALR
ncbi:MAG: hypothetical protein RMK64_09625 [Rhodovarius sp.]|nr:hypothetical protein [Rhodovarius sp.]MCX7933607.1 hypothetical protein [Rhodovarius sp.]MDW8315217.1 hypothetical protein [Rhodovarius sp.]